MAGAKINNVFGGGVENASPEKGGQKRGKLGRKLGMLWVE